MLRSEYKFITSEKLNFQGGGEEKGFFDFSLEQPV